MIYYSVENDQLSVDSTKLNGELKVEVRPIQKYGKRQMRLEQYLTTQVEDRPIHFSYTSLAWIQVCGKEGDLTSA